jgi:DtxR family transcriptional regulator, Mn-dependent transcriptional regulator
MLATSLPIPVTFLLILLAAFLLAIVFHPRAGILRRLHARSPKAKREQIENALKYLFSQEQSGRYASTEAVAGAQNLTSSEALQLVTRMEAQGLVASRNGGLYLTPSGEHWAMQVVRAHRLWERYLADEARLPLDKIHQEAERLEHGMTTEQLDGMAASLGYPQQDPHGDPIPDQSGKLNPVEGVPLIAWGSDLPGRIVHLEDEPPLAYAQILAEGLHLGQTIRVLTVTPDHLLLTDGENEFRLAPVVAANVFVSPLKARVGIEQGVLPLSDLPFGVAAEVFALDESCQGFTRRRLLDLGMTPGAGIEPEMRNFFGDPRAYRIRGTLIALRREQASQVWVKPLS